MIHENINSFELEYLKEEAEERFRLYAKRYRREHDKMPSEKEKIAFIKKYIKEHTLKTDSSMRQIDKEKGQVELLKKLIVRDKKKLSIQEMSEILINEGYTKGSSVKTIYRRILPEITKFGNIKKGADGRYYFDENNSRLRNYKEITADIAEKVSLSITSINIISSFLETIKDSPVYEQAKNFIESEKVQFTRGRREKVKNQNSSSRLLFLGAPEATISTRIWETIYDAMDKNSAIDIHYTAEGRDKEETYTVYPYQLIFDNGSWDLWGECLTAGHKGKRLFNLSRISHVATRAMIKTFELPDDYDFLTTMSGNFGCYNDGKQKVYKIKFQKDSYAWTYSKDRIWGDNQKIEEAEDGYILSFEASQFKPVLRWVLGWGDEAEPVEPVELVDEWKKKIKKIAKKFKI